MDDLKESLHRQCSFYDIGLWLIENTPITAVDFSGIKRKENIPVDEEGNILDAWYAQSTKDLRCGWTANFRWGADPHYVWVARNFVEALNMFTLTPLTIRERHKNRVVAQQHVTVLAEKFPAMWMAQKLSGKVN